jgi:hypothetical protein
MRVRTSHRRSGPTPAATATLSDWRVHVEAHVRAVVGTCQEPGVHQHRHQRLAFRAVEPPQTLRLWGRQPQPWHLQILALDAEQESFARSFHRIVSVSGAERRLLGAQVVEQPTYQNRPSEVGRETRRRGTAELANVISGDSALSKKWSAEHPDISVRPTFASCLSRDWKRVGFRCAARSVPNAA